jgi:integrase
MPDEKEMDSPGDPFYKGLTIQGLMELWLASAQKKMSPQGFMNYRRIVRKHILPELGDTVVDYLTAADVNDFLREKGRCGRLNGKGGLSRKYVSEISYILNAALKLVNWDCQLSPGDHTFVKSMHEKKDTATLTERETEILTGYLVNHLDRSNAGFLLCLYTGIKLSEICSLRDANLLLEKDRLQIRRTLQRVTMREKPRDAGDRQETTDYDPAGSDWRDLALSTRLSMLLWSVLRGGDGTAYFLTGSADWPLGSRSYQYRFQSVLTACGLPQTINFHMLRHTFALMWLCSGGDMAGLSRALGHSSVKVTQARYSDLLQTAERISRENTRLLCPISVK